MASAGQRLNLQFHQPLGGEADHLAQQGGISTLFSSIERSVIISSVIVVTLDQGRVVATRLYPRTTMIARALPLALRPALPHNHIHAHLLPQNSVSSCRFLRAMQRNPR
jgi:hypothetical protein